VEWACLTQGGRRASLLFPLQTTSLSSLFHSRESVSSILPVRPGAHTCCSFCNKLKSLANLTVLLSSLIQDWTQQVNTVSHSNAAACVNSHRRHTHKHQHELRLFLLLLLLTIWQLSNFGGVREKEQAKRIFWSCHKCHLTEEILHTKCNPGINESTLTTNDNEGTTITTTCCFLSSLIIIRTKERTELREEIPGTRQSSSSSSSRKSASSILFSLSTSLKPLLPIRCCCSGCEVCLPDLFFSVCFFLFSFSLQNFDWNFDWNFNWSFDWNFNYTSTEDWSLLSRSLLFPSSSRTKKVFFSSTPSHRIRSSFGEKKTRPRFFLFCNTSIHIHPSIHPAIQLSSHHPLLPLLLSGRPRDRLFFSPSPEISTQADT